MRKPSCLPLAPPFQFWGLTLRTHRLESLRMEVRDRRCTAATTGLDEKANSPRI